MKHMMIDVEALRLRKPWTAPLMSIGMVKFDPTGIILDTMEVFISQDSLPEWADPEESTVNFWVEQPYWPYLQRSIGIQGIPAREAVARMAMFYMDCSTVWFAGPQYDQVILESYLDHYGISRPWRYNDARDFRTVRKHWPEISENVVREGTLHSALDDALHQVKVLHSIWAATGQVWK